MEKRLINVSMEIQKRINSGELKDEKVIEMLKEKLEYHHRLACEKKVGIERMQVKFEEVIKRITEAHHASGADFENAYDKEMNLNMEGIEHILQSGCTVKSKNLSELEKVVIAIIG